MRFFVPAADGVEQAEGVYQSILDFNSAGPQARRIAALHFVHNGEAMHAVVGDPVSRYFGSEVAIAIIDCGSVYKVCTANRGVLRGEGILVGKDSGQPTFFDP